MGTTGDTTLIPFVAKYFVAIFVNLCFYVKGKGCYIFSCSLCFCIVIVCYWRSYKNKNTIRTTITCTSFMPGQALMYLRVVCTTAVSDSAVSYATAICTTFVSGPEVACKTVRAEGTVCQRGHASILLANFTKSAPSRHISVPSSVLFVSKFLI